MKVYSDYPARRTAQITADLVAIGLIAAFVWAGVLVYGAIAVLAAFGKTIEDAGIGFEETMADAGDTLGGVPLIGGGIRQPFDAASGAGTLLAEAGQAQQDLVITAATIIGIVVAVIPILLVLWIWLRRRPGGPGGRPRRATCRGCRTDPTCSPCAPSSMRTIREFHDIHGEPVDAWRRGEKKIVRALAQLELREAGVRLKG